MAFECDIVDRQAEPALVVRTRAPVDRLAETLGPAWGKVLARAGSVGAQPSSRPFVAYHNMDMQDLDLEIGFAFDRPVEGDGDVKASEIPAGKAVEAVHVGPYDRVSETYEELGRWLEENGYVPAGPAYEYYLNDPAEVQPDALLTRVVMPLA